MYTYNVYTVYSISLLLFSDMYCVGVFPFCVPALRKWMTISVLGFDSLPSSLTQMFPKIIFFFQDSNCVYVTQTNPIHPSPFCTFNFIWSIVHPSWLWAILNWQREGMKTHSVTGSQWLRTVIQPLFLSSLLNWSCVLLHSRSSGSHIWCTCCVHRSLSL